MNYLREIASNGGNAVVEKYGIEFMRTIGKLGRDARYEHLSQTALMKTQRLARRIVRENQ